MWGQVSLEKALRAFLTGKTVKVVDFNAETVLSLSEVFERFSEGVVFFAETVATENIEFKEAVEEMVEENKQDDVTEAAEAPAPKKRGRKATNGKSVGRNKPVSQVEAEWAARKITDVPKLKALRTAGWTVKALADEFHCTEETVAETMEKEGIA